MPRTGGAPERSSRLVEELAAGVKGSRAIKQTDIMGWGSNPPLRSDITSDATTLVLEPQETKLETLALYIGVNPEDITPDPTTGVFSIDQPQVDANCINAAASRTNEDLSNIPWSASRQAAVDVW